MMSVQIELKRPKLIVPAESPLCQFIWSSLDWRLCSLVRAAAGDVVVLAERDSRIVYASGYRSTL